MAWSKHNVLGTTIWRHSDGKASVQQKPSGWVLFVLGTAYGKYKAASSAKKAYDLGMFVEGSGGSMPNKNPDPYHTKKQYGGAQKQRTGLSAPYYDAWYRNTAGQVIYLPGNYLTSGSASSAAFRAWKKHMRLLGVQTNPAINPNRASGKRKKNPGKQISWQAPSAHQKKYGVDLMGRAPDGTVYEIESETVRGAEYHDLYMMPPAGSFGGGVREKVCSRGSLALAKQAAEDSYARANYVFRNPSGSSRKGTRKRANPSIGDYVRAGKRAAAEAGASVAAKAQQAVEAARARAEAEAKSRKADDPTVEQAIKVLAKAHGVKINPRGGKAKSKKNPAGGIHWVKSRSKSVPGYYGKTPLGQYHLVFHYDKSGPVFMVSFTPAGERFAKTVSLSVPSTPRKDATAAKSVALAHYRGISR